jgi:hypothetical protein
MTYSVTFLKQMSVRRIKIICKSILIETIENVDDTCVTWNNNHCTKWKVYWIHERKTRSLQGRGHGIRGWEVCALWRSGNVRLGNACNVCNVNISEVVFRADGYARLCITHWGTALGDSASKEISRLLWYCQINWCIHKSTPLAPPLSRMNHFMLYFY